MERSELLSETPQSKPQRQRFDSVARTMTGLAPYTGSWTISEAKHLLKRTMFGSTKTDINTFLTLGMSDSVDTLIELINHPVYTPPPDPVFCKFLRAAAHQRS